MGIADQIKAMRRDYPDCRIATFADLSSGLVLFTSSEERLAQERLDALCARARDLIRGPAQDAAASVLGEPVRHLSLAEGDSLLVIVRAPSEPDEALICDCAPGIDLQSFVQRAARELAALAPVH